ncbi:hypothetical protein SISNIDRAFT_412320 [Sistotremastrum niveocremeum HHB9708]|uniref:Cap binding protein 80-PB n=1 Tax=Sistotremastrum niveocremeum HHB9708 TaxID=1314777 RepID=A0A164TT96_9AGAM|nr:hypothetical protein SISNIDRAFT_412320 [Sistotremastrum niveocremeum HHB9708]
MHDRRREPREPRDSPEQQLRKAICNLGESSDFDPSYEVPRLVEQLRSHSPPNVHAVAEGFRISVTEQPYKIPYLAATVALLYIPQAPTRGEDDAEPVESNEPDSFGSQILSNCWKCCRESMEKKSPRELRSWIHFFAHLTVARIVSPAAMLGFLQNICQALDELAVSYARIVKASLCVAEGLMRAGAILYEHDSAAVTALVDAISGAVPTENAAKELMFPIVYPHVAVPSSSFVIERLDGLVATLRVSATTGFISSLSSYPQPHSLFPALADSKVTSFALDSVLLPPEQVDISGQDDEEQSSSLNDMCHFHLTLFDDDITPNPATPEGYAVRSIITDIVDIYEVNRKDCARVLLDTPKWLPSETFRPKPGAEAPSNGDTPVTQGWQLESTLIDTILSNLLLLPSAPLPSVYYHSLISELCKLSPSTVGPAVGKSFRKLYSQLGDGFDVELVRRYAEWFAVHMSNFGFQWVWKEWTPDLSLTFQHPKRAFIRRVLDLEIRLAYFDRIMRTLPEPFQSPSAGAMPEQAPGPEYDYGDPNHPHHSLAREILNWFQGRTDQEQVKQGIDNQKERLMDSGESEATALSILRFIVVQSLHEIGSRSFSHFLNAMERYIKVMRHISTDSEAKADILEATGKFWRRNPQMISITFDKLQQYQFVEPSDVITWAFAAKNGGGLGFAEWDLIKGALDKANGRVLVAKKKVALQRKEQEDQIAKEKAKVTGEMDVDGNLAQDAPVQQSAGLTTALSASSTLLSDQKLALSKALEGFAALLVDTDNLLSESDWNSRTTWTDEEWQLNQTWNWYRHFCRTYSPHLTTYSKTMEVVLNDKIAASGKNGAAATKLRRFFNIAIGDT